MKHNFELKITQLAAWLKQCPKIVGLIWFGFKTQVWKTILYLMTTKFHTINSTFVQQMEKIWKHNCAFAFSFQSTCNYMKNLVFVRTCL